MTARSHRILVVLGYSDASRGDLHPICAGRLAHAATVSRPDDIVVLSGWARAPGSLPEAELMADEWRGQARDVVLDPGATSTVGNAANAVDAVLRTGVDEVVVVTSRWHAPRASVAFRWALRRSGASVRTSSPRDGSVRDWMRELPRWLVLPTQLVIGRPRPRAETRRR